ncbi:amino acid ABC transporter ATP-binding protein [Weissella fangxianensis]|uniref:amino acid ABC transporter ATP-binding protein n=1 Tax=Weissella fangxianensis TaxID=2953879 RepID=UPI00249DEE5D|nr:amino acid ABC transporter ATP-binding protein [Weissella fangxianensis]
MSMIEFKDVNKFYGDFHALTDINLKVEAGETVVLIGPSGSGKSTLIRTINGLEPVQGGQLIVNGQDLANPKTDMNRTRKNVGMVFQHFNLYANKSVLENIMLAPRLVLHREEEENKKVAMELLDRVGLADQAAKSPSALSGGQQQRIAIARSLAMKPKALLFDEPTSALDPEMINGVLQIIQDIVGDSSMTTLVVTHEMGFAKEVADRVIFMDKGRILEDSPTKEFFSNPKEPRAREFLSQIIR